MLFVETIIPRLIIVISCMLFANISLFAQGVMISDVLPNLQNYIATLKINTANFVCGYEIRRTQDIIQKTTRQRTLINTRYIPSTSNDKSFIPSSWSWEEVIIAPDGTKTIEQHRDYNKERLGTKMINGFDALFSWFDKENEKCFNYELLGNEIIEEGDAYKIRITTKKDRKRAGKICESFKDNWNSTIWINMKTMQIIRLLTDPIKIEPPRIIRTFIKGSYFSTYRIDYTLLLVGKEYWLLPVKNHIISKKNEHIVYETDIEYSNYKLFSSTVLVNFDNLQ